MVQKLQFEIWQDDWCKSQGAFMATFTNDKGIAKSHLFTNPKSEFTNLIHADTKYLKNKFPNIETERHAEYVRVKITYRVRKFPELNNHQSITNTKISHTENAAYVYPNQKQRTEHVAFMTLPINNWKVGRKTIKLKDSVKISDAKDSDYEPYAEFYRDNIIL